MKNTFAYVCWKIHLLALIINGKAEKCEIKKGSRQGWIISPLIFNYYIKGCIGDIVNHGVGCKIGLIKLNVLATWLAAPAHVQIITEKRAKFWTDKELQARQFNQELKLTKQKDLSIWAVSCDR